MLKDQFLQALVSISPRWLLYHPSPMRRLFPDQYEIMLQYPEPDGFPSLGIDSLQHRHPKLLCEGAIFRPRKLLDETFLHPKDRITGYIPAIVGV